jgi:enoyl-CoA hydratase
MVDYSRYEKLKVERDGPVLRVTINLPEKRNALDGDAQREFGFIFQDIADDPQVRVVVLTGAGQSFSVGGDVPRMQGKIDDPNEFFLCIPNSKRIIQSILDNPKPVVCRLNGDAVGLGATIALLSDVVIADHDAKIGDPHVKVGLSAGDGGSAIWPQLIGFAHAKRYLMTGDLLSGREAAALGLIAFSAPAEELDEMTEKWAAKFARGASNAIAGTKMAINATLKLLTATGVDVGMAYEGLSNISDDHQEALNAFVEKRRSAFKGT